MARKPRDYRAEYARRVQRERERAAREGRSFNPSRARGHKESRKDENVRRRLKYWLKKNDDIPQDELDRVLAERRPESVIEKLKLRYQVGREYERGNVKPGRTIWKRYHGPGRRSAWPDAFDWYHGGFG